MSEFGDESVVIDIEFKVKDSKSAEDYIAKTKHDLEMLKKTFEENDPKGNTYLESVKKSSMDTLANLNNTVKKLAEVSTNVEATRSSYMSLQQTIAQMGRSIKSGTGKYAQTTKEEFEAVKQQAKEAHALYQSALHDAKKFTDDIDAQKAKLARTSGEYQSLTHMVKETGEATAGVTTAFKHMDEELANILAREQKELQDLKEWYVAWVKDIQASGQHLSSEEGQLAQRLYHEGSQEIKEYYAQEKLLHAAEMGDMDAVEQLLALEEQRTAEKRKQTQEEIKNLQQQRAAIKESTSQYYYRLRSVKMLGFTLKNIDKTLDGFGKKALDNSVKMLKNYLKLTNVFSMFGGALKDVVGHLKSANGHLKDMHSSTRAIKNAQTGIKSSWSNIRSTQDGINFSLKTMLSNILKYGLGVRSIYMLCRKLRNALSSGMENLATQWEEVNQQMSSVITSLFQMKNAIAAAVQPILTALAPALEKVAEIVSDIAYKVASFIAALTGSTQYVYKAKRAQQKYVDKTKDAADSTEDQADATEDAKDAMEDETEEAEELRKELSKLDKLNVLTTDKQKEPKDSKTKDKKKKDKKLKDIEDDLGDGVQDMFEKVPIDAAAAAWADKLKDLLAKLFAPIKRAWDAEGQFVMDAWKYALQEIWQLIKSIGHDFLEVWAQKKTTEMFKDLFHIIGDIGLIIGNLAHNFRIAWEYNRNGLIILQSIRDILYIIIHGIRQAADYTVEWSKNLDFIPLLTHIRHVLQTQIVPAVQKVVDLLVYLYEVFFLEFLKHFVEQTAPKIVKMIGNIGEAIGNVAENILHALQKGRMGELIVNSIEHIVDVIADTLVDITKSTKKWAKELNFEPLVKAIFIAIQSCQRPIRQICQLLKDLWDNILEPLAKYFIEKALPNALLTITKIVKAIGNIAENLSKAFKENNRGKRIAESLKNIFEKIGSTISKLVDDTLEWSKNVNFGPLVESIAKFFERCEKPVQQICDLLNSLYNKIILPLASYLIEKVLPKVSEFAGDIVETIGNFAKKFKDAIDNSDSFKRALESAKRIGEKVGETIDKIVKKTKEWSEKINFEPLLKSIAGWLESMEEPLSFLCDTFASFYNDVLLPFWQYIVEQGLPKLLDKLKEINEKIDWDKLKKKVDEFAKSFEKFLEKSWDTLIELLGKLGDAIAKFVDSEAFDKIVDKIIEWMDNADPKDMADGIEKLVTGFIGLKASVSLFSKVILPLITDVMTFINFAKQNAMLSKVGKLAEAMGNLATKGGEAGSAIGGAFSYKGMVSSGGAGKGLLASLGSTVGVAAIVVAALANLVFAYGGVEKVAERCSKMVDSFSESLKKVKENANVDFSGLIKSFEDLDKSVGDLVDMIGGEGAYKGLIPAFQELDKLGLEISFFGNIESKFNDLCSAISIAVTNITGFFSSTLQAIDGFVTKIQGCVLVINGYLTGDTNSILKGFELMEQGVKKESGAAKTAVQTAVNGIGGTLDFFARESLPGYALATDAFGLDVQGAFDGLGQYITRDTQQISKDTEQTFKTDIPAAAYNVESDFGVPVKSTFDDVKTTAETDNSAISSSFNQTFGVDVPASRFNVENDFALPVKTAFDDVKTTAETDSAAVATAVEDSFVTKLNEYATNSKTGFFNSMIEAFQLMKYALIGDPIVYDIRDGIINGFNEWTTQTSTDVGTWNTDIITIFQNLANDIGNAMSNLPSTIEQKFGEVKKGIESKCKEAIQTAKDKFGDLKKAAEDKLKSSALQNAGKQFISGLDSSVKSKMGTVKSTVSKGINDVKKKFREGLKSNSLTSIGKQLINGLKTGMMSALSSAYAAISAICAKIIAKAKQAFAVRSPSKVFAEIGKYLMLGLEEGIEDNVDVVGEEFEDMVPSEDGFEHFCDVFEEKAASMTDNVIYMFDNMIQHIDDSMSYLSKLANLNALNNKLSSMNLEVPAIVKGQQMPSNKDFAQNVEINLDLKKLPEMMKEAFIEAIMETSDLQSEDGTIIVNIDGKNVFQAVRTQNAMYKKQHGVSALA